ncbi:MAG: ATP-binding protein [Armatimonadota bacterium]
MVISRHPGNDVARASLEDVLARRLAHAGRRVLVTPHIYHLPHGAELWSTLSELSPVLAVAGWLHPRPLECLVREYAGREPAVAIDLSSAGSAEAAAQAIEDALGPSEGAGEVRELHAEVSDRWYPVIDRSRCNSCRHCLQFCLFGVYETQAHRVVAVRPDNCKDGCPACARVCPQGAIIFPLCDEPAIAGAPGTVMRPDAAARRMYYVRTGRPCPVCGEVAEAGGAPRSEAEAAMCEECGGAVRSVAAEPSAVHEEIDSLIDALDDLARGGEAE